MHPITITTLQTNIPIQHSDLEAVKKAIGVWLKQKDFKEHGHIHNHETDEDPGFKKQDYPLIQLRCQQDRLMLWGMNNGAEVLQKIMLREMFRGFQFQGTQCRIIPARTDTLNHELGFMNGKELKRYSLNYFVALNPANAKAWQELPTASRRIERIEELLKNNIAMFCKAAGFVLDKEKLVANIYWIWKTNWVKIKDFKVASFTLDYDSNLEMPDGIALGRQTKLGYGWQTNRTENENDLVTPSP
ncbi:MAG: CRISPR-associated endonuclease Cas6 [Chitinophagaceae bacterium]